ncbi:MAG: DegT/DnrJ/EryC1/StrS family aminotransferase [Solirubrobacterales bacterium]|nr:DegT/DnrJ/EryC1/StrS family aminotransferase [Solirubrobacterales bacterium]
MSDEVMSRQPFRAGTTATDTAGSPASPFLDLSLQHKPLMAELQAAFDRVVGGSSFILGEEVERFEREFAAYCGVRECIGVASGTAALTLALMAAGVGRGDEVIVPAHTYIATALGVTHAGAKPVFCDVDDATGLIDVTSAASVVSPRTVAIVPVHLYGQVCDMKAVATLADRHGLLVLEDAAQAHGATYSHRRAGSFGNAAAFSFYPSKNLGALGDGGAICTSDPGLADRARELRHLGQRRKGEHVVFGFNERLDGLQAALLRVKLPYLSGWNRRRREVAAIYRQSLAGAYRLLEEKPESPCIYHLFPIRTRDRDQVARYLASERISCGVHYSPAVHHHPPFASGDAPIARLQRAESWAREELSLPLYPELDPDEALRIADTCRCAITPSNGGAQDR